MKRVKQFKMKYPDFAFVVPEALVRDVERDPTFRVIDRQGSPL